MKIAVVSKADATGGGASRVAHDIVEALNERSIYARHLATRSSQQWTDLRKPIFGPRLPRVIITRLQNFAREMGLGELIPFEAVSVIAAISQFDVVHFHDTSSAFSPLTLLLVSKLKPVVWTFHDCSPFTGGCLYPQTTKCERYKTGCGNCPQLGEWPLSKGLFDLTHKALEQRQLLHRNSNITCIAPSMWMKQTAEGSGSMTRPVRVVSNMVDTQLFAPTDDMRGLRRRLSLPLDRPVITLSSGLLSDTRKGVAEGLECVRSIRHLNPVLVLIGNPDPTLKAKLSDIECIPTGYIRERPYLAEWLAASDLFLFTSKADNQPLSIAESLACGTPVYGYPTGGASEMIIDGQTGRLVSSYDPCDLASVIRKDINSGVIGKMRPLARSSAIEKFNKTDFVDRHLSIYREVVA